jgi:hypothetical protein
MQEKLNVMWPRVNVSFMKGDASLWLRLRVPDELPKSVDAAGEQLCVGFDPGL